MFVYKEIYAAVDLFTCWLGDREQIEHVNNEQSSNWDEKHTQYMEFIIIVIILCLNYNTIHLYMYVIEFNSISHFVSIKNADIFVFNLNIKKRWCEEIL